MEQQNAAQLPWSRESFQLTHLEHATGGGGMQSQIQHIDQLESRLLQDGTVWSEEALMGELRAADRAQAELQSRSTTPSHEGIERPENQAEKQQSDGGEDRLQKGRVHFHEEDNMIIFGTGTISPWNSDKDEHDTSSEIETHAQGEKPEQVRSACDGEMSAQKTKRRASDEADGRRKRSQAPSRKLVRNAIREQSVERPIAILEKKREVTPSVQLLTDRFLNNWSSKEKKCIVYMRRFAHLGNWTTAV